MNQQEIFVQMALKAWQIHIGRTDKFIEGISDESFYKEIAPGKNRIIYLVGHLIAVNDTMLSLFGIGDRIYASYDDAFVKNPDNPAAVMPNAAVLRQEWKKSNDILNAAFEKLSAADWFAKHTAMSDEDLAKEPGRNKLSVLINRTNHLAYHLGQLLLVKE